MSKVGKKISNLFKSSAIVFVGLIFGKGLALFAETLIARSLSPIEYGSLTFAYTVAIIGGRTASLGTQDGVARLVSASPNRSNRIRLLQHALGLVLLSGCLITIGLLLLKNTIGDVVGDASVPHYLILFSPLVILFPLQGITFNTLRAEAQSTSAVLSRDIIGRIVPLAIFGFVLFLGMPILGAVGYWVSIPLSITVASFVSFRNTYSITEIVAIRPNLGIIKRLGKFSLPLMVSTYIFLALSYIDIVMIGFFLNSDQVGFYRAIQPLQQTSTLLMTAFTFLFLPVATQLYEDSDIDSLDVFYTASTKWLGAGTLPLVLVFGLFASDVVRVLFGADYLPAAPALELLVFGQFFRAIVGLDGDIVKAIDRTEIELGSAVVGVLADISLNIYLIPRYGIVGAAFGTVIGYFVYNVVEVLAIYRNLGIHPFSFNNFKPLIVTFLFALGTRHFVGNVNLGIGDLFILGFIFSIVMLLSIIITGSLDDTDLELINRVEERLDLDLAVLKRMIKTN